jgi:hypothetical protein
VEGAGAVNHSRKLLVIGVVVLLVASFVALAGGGFLNLSGRPSSTSPATTFTRSTCDRPPGFILIIADLSGFNDSIGHGAPVHPWPIVRVEKGQLVRFLVCNFDPTQAHGFAITYYFDSGVPMMPGQAYKIVFTATKAGTFDIYCNIFCTIHVFMRGQLIVK